MCLYVEEIWPIDHLQNTIRCAAIYVRIVET